MTKGAGQKMKIILLIISCFIVQLTNAQPAQLINKRNKATPLKHRSIILPSRYGIKNNGTLNNRTNLVAWLNACKELKSPVYFPKGKYLLPADFEFDFGNADLLIKGDGPGNTILSTYNGPETNFAIPEKIDLTKERKSKDGIYQVDIIAGTVHRDFISVSNVPLDSYIKIDGSEVIPVSLAEVKALGYITELDASSADPGIDGIYVVSKHAKHEYGGGFAHLTLGFPGSPLYVQGTILQRKNGTWSRYYSSVAFIGGGNFSVKNISFRNFRPYLFLPAAKKRNTVLKTSDFFIFENCRFEHTARILATMAYAGIQETENWYKASSYYPINGSHRFKRFIIKGNEFSYIHESISWGTPPAGSYTIMNNHVHDCYTMLNGFYLFPPYNTSLPVPAQSKFAVTGNKFIRIRALNAGSENTVHLLRTMNKGIIFNNTFIDCTGIHLYLDGSTRVSGNMIKCFMADVPALQPRPPLILVKLARQEAITISNNRIYMGMMGNFIANESQASFNVYNNQLTGPGIRYITKLSVDEPALDMYRTYIINNIQTFQKKAGTGKYDSAARLSEMVYFNKRKTRWEKVTNIPLMYLYSEVNHFNKVKQYVRFSGNEIETGYLTRIQKNVQTVFNAVYFENNRISFCTGMNAGNEETIINSYRFTGNIVKNGSLSMTSLGNVSASVRYLNISNNTFETGFTGTYSFASSDSLILLANVFTGKKNSTEMAQEQYSSFSKSALPLSTSLLSLKGSPAQVMSIRQNRFSAEMTKGIILSITEPDNVIISKNEFNMKIPAWQATTGNLRNAILFKTNNNCSSINITGNSYLPEPGKENYLVRFDESASVINNMTFTGNKTTGNAHVAIKTIEARNKTFTNYYRGINTSRDEETILKVGNSIKIK